MAQTDVPVTAGSGTNIDGFATSGTGNIRQTIVIGDKATDANVAPVDATKGLAVDLTASGSNTNKLLVTPDLPSGASTAAKQPALGTAGSASSDVLTIQGVASMTKLLVTPDLPSGAATSANQTTANTSLSTIATNIPAQGQALEAASMPIVLTAAQVTTLTPPAAITGFATAAKQPALGTAGSASSDVLTVQGKTSMTPLLVDGSGATQPVSGTFWQTTQPVSLASVPSHAVTNAGTFATQATLQANSGVDIGKLTANQSVNVAQVNGVTALMGNGVTGTGSQRVTVASDNTPFQVSASDETSTIYNGTTALTPKFATITASSSGVTNLLALVSSKKLRVLSLALVANGTVNVKFQSHVTPTDITGLFYLVANTGFVLPYNPLGWFQSISGEALDINLSASIAVGGTFTYVEV